MVEQPIWNELMQPTFDRAAEDLGNSIHLEHVNVSATMNGTRWVIRPEMK